MVCFGTFMSWPVGKCPNMERSYLFSLKGKQKKIAQLIVGHPVVSKFDLTNLWKYFTLESAGGRILTFCMSGLEKQNKTTTQ
jgi:hypothetical protein